MLLQIALYPTLRLIDAHLVRWVMRKYKRFKQRPRQARLLARQNREIHAGTVRPLVSALRKWLNAGSRMSREVHVRFWERVRVKSPRATRLPLYRQSRIFERDGLDLDRSTLADWVGKNPRRWWSHCRCHRTTCASRSGHCLPMIRRSKC